MPIPRDIDPWDSYVLRIEGDDRLLTLLVEAALSADHPAFYWPPKPGEQHAYAKLQIALVGKVEWVDGPHPRRFSDASGENDYGDLGSWRIDDEGAEHLEGDWGHVVVTGAQQTVEVIE